MEEKSIGNIDTWIDKITAVGLGTHLIVEWLLYTTGLQVRMKTSLVGYHSGWSSAQLLRAYLTIEKWIQCIIDVYMSYRVFKKENERKLWVLALAQLRYLQKSEHLEFYPKVEREGHRGGVMSGTENSESGHSNSDKERQIVLSDSSLPFALFKSGNNRYMSKVVSLTVYTKAIIPKFTSCSFFLQFLVPSACPRFRKTTKQKGFAALAEPSLRLPHMNAALLVICTHGI